MGLMDAPKGMRLHIGLFGRRNVGKSSLLNAITRQEVCIVSDFAGTTTDPVEKPMELLPLGPVLFIDTAGIDDVGVLGELRARRPAGVRPHRPRRARHRGRQLGRVRGRHPRRVARARDARSSSSSTRSTSCEPTGAVSGAWTSSSSSPCRPPPARARACSTSARRCSTRRRRTSSTTRPSSATWSAPGELAVLVVPIDKEAPQGPPDPAAGADASATCWTATRCAGGQGARAARRPRAAQPAAEARGHRLAGLPEGRRRHAARRADDELLASSSRASRATWSSRCGARWRSTTSGAATACSSPRPARHHPIAEDIGRVKIPRWLTQYVGGKLQHRARAGARLPRRTSRSWDLVIHCGACMCNRRAMLTRILRCRQRACRSPTTAW